MATGALFVLCFSHSPGGSELFNYRLATRYINFKTEISGVVLLPPTHSSGEVGSVGHRVLTPTH